MRFIIIWSLFLIPLFSDHQLHHLNKELSHIDLSSEQMGKVKEVLCDFRKRLKELEERRQKMEDKMKDLFLKDTFDADEAESLNFKIDAMSREIEKEFLQKIHVILKPSQRSRFVDYFDEWRVE